MYTVKKTIEIAGAHQLALPYDSKCCEVHGHNWIITVECRSENLLSGMVVDFAEISEIVKRLDHRNLNEFIEQPTAENIAKYIYDLVPRCFRVTVQESQGNVAVYELQD